MDEAVLASQYITADSEVGSAIAFCVDEDCDCTTDITSNSCFANICFCNNGIANGDGYCMVDATEECASCDTGYSLVVGVCTVNVCTCSHGTENGIGFCLNNNAEECATCDSGYYLNDGICLGYRERIVYNICAWVNIVLCRWFRYVN